MLPGSDAIRRCRRAHGSSAAGGLSSIRRWNPAGEPGEGASYDAEEESLFSSGACTVAGVDEVGQGAWAGPVMSE